MKKLKFSSHFIFVAFVIIVTASCSPKNYPAKNEAPGETIVSSSDTVYIPSSVISIPDEKAKTNRDGELYFDDANGYRYWRHCDGMYYLDSKYKSSLLPKSKMANRKKNKKLPKNKSHQTETEDYSSL